MCGFVQFLVKQDAPFGGRDKIVVVTHAKKETAGFILCPRQEFFPLLDMAHRRGSMDIPEGNQINWFSEFLKRDGNIVNVKDPCGIYGYILLSLVSQDQLCPV